MEILIGLTKEENENKVGMIKRKCSVCCFLLDIQVNNSTAVVTFRYSVPFYCIQLSGKKSILALV